ncbi:15560_t:CDS:2, partial [Racocetra fulgida]
MREYRKGWAMRMMNYQKKMEQYDGDEMENIIPPERLEIWDMRHVLVTHDEVYFYANDDNLSFWVEDKESIIKKKGQGMTMHPKVEDKFKFKDGWFIRNYEKITQPMLFLDENDSI